MKQLIAVAVALLMTSVPLSAQKAAAASRSKGEEQAVLSAVRKTTEAIRQNNADELGEMLADDYYFVGARGNVMNKKEQLAAFREGKTKFEEVTTADEKVRLFTDAAVVTLVRHQKGRTVTGPVAADVRVLYVFAHRSGRWLLVVSQQTNMPG